MAAKNSEQTIETGLSSGLVPSQPVAATAVANQPFPHNLPEEFKLFLAQNGNAYATNREVGNPYVQPISGRAIRNRIRRLGTKAGLHLRKSEINEIVDFLQAHAETAGVCKLAWYRVASVPGGIEIDLGDDTHERYRITEGRVDLIASGSESLFYRTATCQPMVRPAEVGNLKLLKSHVNLDDVSFMLYVAWLSYTLAHPKAASTVYVILLVQGGQGSGKSRVSRVLIKMLDPSLIGVQVFPTNGKDLAIASQNAHLNCYDNVRSFSPAMADNLCIAATGGAIVGRQLYTDAEQQVISLHGAVVINGIHSFIDQPDLAQRCLPLHLNPMTDVSRKSEAQLDRELQADLPAIQRGLFDLIANVFKYLSTATVTNPERMIDFCQWLAAMEMVDGVPAGVYQAEYSNVLNQGQRDSLQENVLAAAILEFAEARSSEPWSGAPADLLGELNRSASHGIQRSRDWPLNPIALSKRLVPLQAGLHSQGVSVELSRGKTRVITIKTK